MRPGETFELVPLHDDAIVDELRLVGTDGKPVVRVVTRYRYKVGPAGDEWRTSAWWQSVLAFEGSAPVEGDPLWRDFDGPHNTLSEAVCHIYPGIYRSQRPFHNVPILRIDVLRKGVRLYEWFHDAERKLDPRPLLTVCGHLPSGLLRLPPPALEAGLEATGTLCAQGGCQEPAVSLYALRGAWGGLRPRRGAPTPARRFCRIHLRRGTGRPDDRDSAYIVREGPGPADASGWEPFVSKARVQTVVVGERE